LVQQLEKESLMPLVAISLSPTAPPTVGEAIGNAVHAALIDALGIPPEDHFQIISRAETLVCDSGYLGVQRGSGFLVIQIYLARGRSLEQKQALYRAIAELLELRCAIRPEDVFINLVEVEPEDFSFGCGIAQYAGAIPPHLAGGATPGNAGFGALPGLGRTQR
jgi:phenylpyruvate tautomerase PptA (4-oxalocrotonate tautomerase family)